MKNKKKRKNKKKHTIISSLDLIFKLIWFVIKIPYYITKGVYSISRFTSKKIEHKKEEKKRQSIKAVYDDFEIININEGDFKTWENKIMKSDSKIGIILGARGSGKTAFGMKFLENLYAKTKKHCYAIGFIKEEMPSWIEVIDDINQIRNNSFVLIDEGGVLFSSRRSMTNANKMLSDLILISRHKNISILFISQNSSNLDVNIVRQADYLILKPSSLLQKDFERKIIKNLYEEVSQEFKKYKDSSGIAYLYSDYFRGFISNPLPSFWNVKISKSFKEG